MPHTTRVRYDDPTLSVDSTYPDRHQAAQQLRALADHLDGKAALTVDTEAHEFAPGWDSRLSHENTTAFPGDTR